MDISKRILLGLIISIGSFPLPIYAANDDTAELKSEVAVLQNQVQILEKRLDSIDKSNAKSNISKDISTDPSIKKKKKHTKKIKTTQEQPVIPSQTTLAYNKNNPATILNTPSTGNYSPNTAPQKTLTTAIIPPLSWQGPDISAAVVGGASAGYSKPSSQNGSFNILDFNPIFLFSYDDLLFLRGALDFQIDDYGNTQTSLDYTNLNLFLSNYATFGVGKFDSAIGYFVQNLSPAWINKLPTPPVGFDSDEAAPQAEVGIQLRGGFPLFGDAHANYIFYLSNGPQGFVDTTNNVIDYIDTDGFTNSFGNYVVGGRLGFLPIPDLEIGISAAGGKLVLLDSSDGTTVLQNGRDYNVLGADISYTKNNLDLRGEIVQQQVSSQENSKEWGIAPQGEKWTAWYLQAAYRFPSTNWEPVVRYGNFTAPLLSQLQQRQWAFGINYWFAPSIAAQAAYEVNHGQRCTSNNANMMLIQLVFGF